ncbi:DUF523 domain-containing protein [Patescibacteria group bacterium]|nr:DUF523 domain-containing protein [Patescibacteria group bacterium]MCG2693406.1 DUF523 domain-containing protein [Candidatus Parcubacteria bacterium]
MKLISACLLGIKCRYDGKYKPCPKAIALFKKGILIPVCPEQLGGLPTPRVPAEIQGGNGEKVIQGVSKLLNKNGHDVTSNFLKGANEALKIAKITNTKEFIGKSKSPSCGLGRTYNGSFTGTLVQGDGVTVALFKKNGISVISENDL